MSSEPSSKKEAVQSVIKALVDAVYVAKSKGENINPGVEALKQEVFEQVAQANGNRALFIYAGNYINVKERERNKLEEERLLAKAEQEGTPFKKRGALPPLINISLWENSLPDILPPKQQSQTSARDSNSGALAFLFPPYTLFRELRRAWRRYFDPGRNKLDPPLETIPILAGLVQITFSVIVLGLVIAAAVGAGPFAPLAPVALLAVAVGAFWGAMIMGRAIGAALAVIAFVNPFLEHHQGKTGTMTSKPGMKPMSIVGTGLGCGLIGWESLTERRKSRLAKSKAEARRHSQGNESITMEKSRSYSDSAQASLLSTKTSSSRAGSFSEFGEETPFLAGGSTSSNNSPRESFSDLGMPPPSVARSSTASVLGRLTPDQQNLILTVQLRKQVSVNEMQLVEEAGRNYLLYKADELENTQQRLSTRRDGMISMERTAPNDIKAMLHPSIEGAEKLLARVKRVAGIHRMVKELDTDAGRDMLLKKQSELSAIVKGWDSEKMNGDDLRKTNKSVDNLLTDLEQKLDVALKAKGVALPKVAEDVQSEQPKSRGMHH